MNPNSIGLIEVRGWVAAIEAGDAMVKAAKVRLLRQHSISPGLVTVVVEGDLGSCRAAVDAGTAAAKRIGGFLAQLVIGRPDRDTWMLSGLLIASDGNGSDPGGASSCSNSSVGAAQLTKAPAVIKPSAGALDRNTIGPQRAAMLAYIVARNQGGTVLEVARRFKLTADLVRTELDSLVNAGQLRLSGRRYLAPESGSKT
jgi:ethanolamine utilization protein EutK